MKVRGFNGGLVNCVAKAELEWEMEEIKTKMGGAWVLPTMAYDIIVGTDWIEANNPRIDFGKRKMEVKEKEVDLTNIREDLVRECTMIQA